MECPYCLEDFNEEALVCKDCGRDLRLVRPVINENLRLLAQVVELEDQVHKARSAVARTTTPLDFLVGSLRSLHFGAGRSAYCGAFSDCRQSRYLAAFPAPCVHSNSVAVRFPAHLAFASRNSVGNHRGHIDRSPCGDRDADCRRCHRQGSRLAGKRARLARDPGICCEHRARQHHGCGAGDFRAPHAAKDLGCHGGAGRCRDNDRANCRTSRWNAGVAPSRPENSG